MFVLRWNSPNVNTACADKHTYVHEQVHTRTSAHTAAEGSGKCVSCLVQHVYLCPDTRAGTQL